MPRLFVLVSVIFLSASPAIAQNAASGEPPLRRWLEFQTLSLSTRYRFIESNSDHVSSNDMQYKEVVRGRVNLDARRRYTINFGTASGNGFISSWDNTGWGINDGDIRHHYLKALYASAIPVPGLELQFGGLYIARGEATEFTTYDEDGFATGGRVTIRRPEALYLDDLTVTYGTLGPMNRPNVNQRWKDLDDPNYTQVLGAKRFSQMVAASLGYTSQSDMDIVRAAISLRFKPTAPITGLRYEQYHRFNANEASGFAVTAERPITKWVRLQGGYATIDEFYGGWNADRIQRGRRFFAMANVPITGPLSASFFFTQALDADYSISNRTRFDAVLAWDVLNTLRQTGRF